MIWIESRLFVFTPEVDGLIQSIHFKSWFESEFNQHYKALSTLLCGFNVYLRKRITDRFNQRKYIVCGLKC